MEKARTEQRRQSLQDENKALSKKLQLVREQMKELKFSNQTKSEEASTVIDL